MSISPYIALKVKRTRPKNRTQNADMLADYLVDSIRNYTHDHFYKFAGAGITKALADMSPNLCPRLWAELDIVPLVFERGIEDPLEPQPLHGPLSVDEEADRLDGRSASCSSGRRSSRVSRLVSATASRGGCERACPTDGAR